MKFQDRISEEEILRLEKVHFPVPQEFPLWEFEWSGLTACTRGRTPEEALEYLFEFPANAKMKTSLPIDYGAYYGLNHAPGWLFRPPVWLLRKMELERSKSAVGA